MLHQTLPISIFNPLPSLNRSSLLSLQEKPEMEAKALKTSCLWPEMKQETVAAVVEDVWGCGNGCVNGGGSGGDDFFVDELLNFSKEEEGVWEDEEEEEKDCFSVSSQEENENSFGVYAKHDFDSVPTSELSVPTDDLADLEWLSNFVDDSFTTFSLPLPPGPPPTKPQNPTEPEKTSPTSLKTGTFPTRIPVKARTKRTRTGGRIWSMGSTTPSSSSSTSSSTSGLIFTNTPQNLDLFYCLANTKKQRKRHLGVGGSVVQRRCSHCGVQKTPQWRSGPMGAKTLCNACGVRFKSGRLLPEYRPACSPTFSSEFHSNSHRKVLEMRRKKEVTEMIVGPEPVQSF